MSAKELANQFRESLTMEHQLTDLDIIKLFSSGIKGIQLEESIEAATSRNGFLQMIEKLSEERL